nr:MAG TPA: hypothetical protein [Siphoviridae sp. cta6m1]
MLFLHSVKILFSYFLLQIPLLCDIILYVR